MSRGPRPRGAIRCLIVANVGRGPAKVVAREGESGRKRLGWPDGRASGASRSKPRSPRKISLTRSLPRSPALRPMFQYRQYRTAPVAQAEPLWPGATSCLPGTRSGCFLERAQRYHHARTVSEAWGAEIAGLPEFIISSLHIVTGLVLPIGRWFPQNHCRVFRLQIQ